MSALPANLQKPVPDALELTRILLRMDTVNPPGNEDQCTHYLAELLTAAGYDCRLVEFAPRRSTLVARIGGSPANRVGR